MPREPSARRTVRTRIGPILVTMAVIAAGLALLVRDPYEMTRLRNAFIVEPGVAADFQWTPDAPPEGFRHETAAPPPELARAAAEVLAAAGPEAGNWERALALAQHLGEGPRRSSGGVLSDTVDAYRRIREEGRGYCADFTQVMNGLGHAAGVPVREWGMSFDGYSGRGHAFSEVWDERRRQWVFFDSFYSLYAVDTATGAPLSALALRDRLLREPGREGVRMVPIDPARFAFPSPAKALAYYRRGAEQFFLVFGNDVISYDAQPVIDFLGDHSRALEQGAAILLGVYPVLRLVPSAGNDRAIARLDALAALFLTGVVALAGLTLLLYTELRQYRRPGS